MEKDLMTPSRSNFYATRLVSWREWLIKQYQPSLVLQNVRLYPPAVEVTDSLILCNLESSSLGNDSNSKGTE